jgi:diguanylate cyclase (GGDEF)-like protein/PAS domain S-box-containing protein
MLLGWRRLVLPVVGLIVATFGIGGCVLLLTSSLREHDVALHIARLQADVLSLSAIENRAESGDADVGFEDMRAVNGRLLVNLTDATDRLPPHVAEAIRADVVDYANAVHTTVAGFLTDGDDIGTFDDEVTEPLFESLNARFNDLVTEADEAAHRTSVAATVGLAVIQAAALAGAVALFVVGSRVHRRQGATQAATRLDARFRAIVEDLRDYILIVDDEGMIRYASPSVEAYLEPNLESVPLSVLLDPLPAASQEQMKRLLEAPEATGTILLETSGPDGDAGYLEAMASDQRDNPNVRGLVITARDVTDQVNLQKRLQHQATTDELTGLPNRRALNEASARSMARARRSETQVGLVLVDLDGFKGINDAMGHQVGDDLLVQAARRLESACRAHELLVRLGGDEFAVLLEEIPSDTDARSVARRLLDALRDPYELEQNLIAVHASLGVAVVDGSLSYNDLFRHADVALYEAKERGRNQLVVYETGMDSLMQTEVRLRHEMASGFTSGEFSMAYQPLLDVRTGRPTGLEALMRWNSATLGPVSPAAFIPIAERSGMIVELGLWALRTACSQLVAWQQEDDLDDDLSMSVNVSIAQLQEQGFVDQLTQIIAETGIAPSHLVLEITESVLAQRPTEVAAVLARVRELGIQVALDDFGSGYSSMSQLQRLPVDEIKIDKEFVQALSDGGPGSRSMVDTLFALGHSMGLRTVAEGVEDLDQLHALEAQHCDVAQGYLFARPMPPKETLEFLRTFNLPVRQSPGGTEDTVAGVE